MDFSYRLPFVRKWLTLYSDSLVHDDVSPPSAPRRAGIRPGIYLSHFPGLAPLDFRVEAASTDPFLISLIASFYLPEGLHRSIRFALSALNNKCPHNPMGYIRRTCVLCSKALAFS